jgi:hypothetical protein
VPLSQIHLVSVNFCGNLRSYTSVEIPGLVLACRSHPRAFCGWNSADEDRKAGFQRHPCQNSCPRCFRSQFTAGNFPCLYLYLYLVPPRAVCHSNEAQSSMIQLNLAAPSAGWGYFVTIRRIASSRTWTYCMLDHWLFIGEVALYNSFYWPTSFGKTSH